MKTNDILLEKGAASPSTSPSPTAASETAPAGRTPLSAAESPAAPAPSAPARPLPKRIALITGGSSGLGREFAVQIDAMQVVDEIWLVARNEEALEAVAAALSTPACIIVADLTNKDDIADIAAALGDAQPRMSYLVNAAGFGKFGDWQAISNHTVDAMVDLNCRALVDVTRASPQAAALRLIGKVVPSCITMAGWNLLRRL